MSRMVLGKFRIWICSVADTMCEEIDQLSEENIGTESDDSSVDGENTILLKGKQELS